MHALKLLACGMQPPIQPSKRLKLAARTLNTVRVSEQRSWEAPWALGPPGREALVADRLGPLLLVPPCGCRVMARPPSPVTWPVEQWCGSQAIGGLGLHGQVTD